MSYIGAVPTTGDFKKLDSITTSSSTTFNLRQGGVAVYPQSANHCIVSLNGVIQAPVDAFTIVNDTIVFASSLASSDVINFILVLGNVNDIGVPSDDTVSTAKLQANAVTTAKITDGNVTAAKIASGVVPSLRPTAQPIIINGNCAISQKGTAATDESTGGYYRVDRMYFAISSMGEGRLQQESLTSGNAFDNGFRKAWRVDCAVADASPAASDYMYLQYNLEGQALQVFKKGTSNAEKFTLAFWVKSSKTGTGNIQLKDKDNSNRQCTQSYTISSANTWEHKVCVFGADTTGAFDDDAAKSLNINWWLDSGSNYDSGTANHGTWEAQDNTKVNAGGTLNIQDNTANDWAITGIQLEVGEYTSSTLPPFQFESYGDNLMRCRRYTQLHMNTDQNGGPFLNQCFAYTSSNWQSSLQLVPPMRAVPTVTSVSSTSAYVIFSNGGTINYNQIDLNDATLSGGVCTTVDLALDGASGGTAGHAGKTRGNSTGAGTMLLLQAEL
jgi:hypothetical protein